MRFCLVVLGLMICEVHAVEQTFKSGLERVSVVELFTSEGCSSCPPAERWLSSLLGNKGLWSDFVPVEFHVDYWDGLGWKDRFAKPEFTQRQRSYAASWGTGTVYTPAIVVNGKPERISREVPGRGGSGGELTLTFHDDGKVEVRFSGSGAAKATVVLLGTGLASDVKAGENRGRTLKHEFVALAMEEAQLSDGRAELSVEVPTRMKPARIAIAGWVSGANDPASLQATGGWIER